MEQMNWHEAAHYMREYNRKINNRTKGTTDKRCVMVAVISEDSFTQEYTLEERSYEFTNDNKAFIDGMGGYSIFASSLDGSDHVRLEQYLKDEGIKDGWKVDYVYIKSED